MRLTKDQLLVMEKVARKDLEFGCIVLDSERYMRYVLGDTHWNIILSENIYWCEIIKLRQKETIRNYEIIWHPPHIWDCIAWIEEVILDIENNLVYDEDIIEEFIILYKNKRQHLFYDDNKEAYEFILLLIKELWKI